MNLTKSWNTHIREQNEYISTYSLYRVSTASPAHYRYTRIFFIWMNLQAYFVCCCTKSCQHLFYALRVRIPETKKTILLIHFFLHWQHSTFNDEHSPYSWTPGFLKFKWELQYLSLDLVFCNLFSVTDTLQIIFWLEPISFFSIKNIQSSNIIRLRPN